MLSVDSAKIALPSSTFVPASLTTSGTSKDNASVAAITPLAMMSQRMIPPKILTSIPFTFGSSRIIENAVLTCSSFAPPPTSRKFAGSPPYNLITSIVAIANPAPLTKQPMFPSSFTYDKPDSFALISTSSSSLRSRMSSQFLCLNSAFSSNETFESSATISSSPVLTRGLISTIVQSFETNMLYIFASIFINDFSDLPDIPRAIPRSLLWNPINPELGSIEIL